jgi:hypothetical protein
MGFEAHNGGMLRRFMTLRSKGARQGEQAQWHYMEVAPTELEMASSELPNAPSDNVETKEENPCSGSQAHYLSEECS